ncbi:MAG: CoA-binding protein [Deltaproteobacteria bacterium]|nr:CoA-binding protein [Deltaproteobacteria bacterium]
MDVNREKGLEFGPQFVKNEELAALLREVKTVAVLGAKDKPSQAVDRVGRYLLDHGFTVVPVHPVRTMVWGLEAYPSLGEVPGPIDLVDAFRAAVHCPGHVREALALAVRPRIFWVQSGIISPEAMSLAKEGGMVYIEDRCLMVEHDRLLREGWL